MRRLQPADMALCAVLVLGVAMRLSAGVSYPIAADLLGDAQEYHVFAADLLRLVRHLDVDLHLDRAPGLPLLLAPLQAVFGPQAAVQRSLTLVLSCLVPVVLAGAARRRFGSSVALLAAAITVPTPGLVAHGPAGLTEELYSLLALAAVFLLLQRDGASGWSIGAACAGLVLAKSEGWLLVLPVLAAYAATGPRPLARRRLLPALLLPAVALAAYRGLIWASGVLPIDQRHGNYMFFAEFLTGRMPWGYMRDLRVPSLRMTYGDWLLGYHSWSEIVGLAAAGVAAGWELLTAQWTPVIVLLVGPGVVLLVRARAGSLPGACAVMGVPYVFVLGFYPESRFLVPLLPLLAVCAAFAVDAGLRRLWPEDDGRSLAATGAACGLLVLVATFGRVPADSRLPAAATEAMDVCQAGYERLNAGEVEAADSLFRRAATLYPAFAPSHFGLATLDYLLGRRDSLDVHLQRSIQSVPYYAEAYVLWSLQADPGDGRRPEDLLRACLALRPDYLPAVYRLAMIEAMDGRCAEAVVDLTRYMEGNRQRLEATLAFCRQQECDDGEVARLERLRQSDNPLEWGRIDDFVWRYGNHQTVGFGTQNWLMDDTRLGVALGACYEAVGDTARAIENYGHQLVLYPNESLRTYLEGLRGSVAPASEAGEAHAADGSRSIRPKALPSESRQ